MFFFWLKLSNVGFNLNSKAASLYCERAGYASCGVLFSFLFGILNWIWWQGADHLDVNKLGFEV